MESSYSTRLIPLAGLLLLAGCGGERGPSEPADAQDEWDAELVLVDSIGVEVGDTSYVFGSIEAVGHTIEGNLLALDRPAGHTREYTPDGEFVRQYGRHGSGPGEFMNPHSMIRTGDGRVVVLDLYTGGFQSFDLEGNWEGVILEKTTEPILWLSESDGNNFVGTVNEFYIEDGNLMVHAEVAEYGLDSLEAIQIYWENTFAWDPSDITPLIDNSYFAMTWTSNRDGYVFVAPRSSKEYTINGYAPDGSEFLTITMDLPRTAKGEEEIADEAEFWNRRAESMGANGPFNYRPDPYRWMIHSMGIDGQDRLWVRRGTEETPTFDVFDFEGNRLFTAAMPEISGPRGLLWEISIDELGILAFSLDPVDGYQKLYIVDIVGEE